MFINQLINKFSSDYVFALATAAAVARAAPGGGFASDKRDVFWKRYYADEAFRKQMNSSYAYSKHSIFDFWQSSDELREYLRPELKSAEVILVEPNKASVLSLKQLERAVSEARSVEELQKLVLKEQSSKANIWFELERRLENNCEIRVIT